MDVELLLAESGYAVLGPAPSVARALAILEAEAPDAALLDLNLAGESSAPVARALRGRSIPFVVVSGYGEAMLDGPGLEGAPSLRKPCGHAELLSALRAVMMA